MRQPEPNKIHVGLKFKSTSFSDTAEVVAVSNDKADVKLTNSEGHAKIIRGWSLPYMRDCFNRGEYYKPEREISFGI
jgi:hypothetical protein